MSQVMGFQGEAFIGTAGSTGATRLTNARDIGVNMEPTKGRTTVRGNSDVPPIETEEVTLRVASFTIQMLNDTADTALQTMLTAVYSGGRIALRLKDYAAGKGFDGDVTLGVGSPYPLDGEQVLDFTATPSRASRTPLLYV